MYSKHALYPKQPEALRLAGLTKGLIPRALWTSVQASVASVLWQSKGTEACENSCQAGNKINKLKQEGIASMIALLHTRIKFEKSETPTTRMGIQRLDI
jgi:hypothetical protein